MSNIVTIQPLKPQIKIITYGEKYKRTNCPDADSYWNCQRLDNPPGNLWDFNGVSKPIQLDIQRQISNSRKHLAWFQEVLNYAVGWAQYAVKTSKVPTLAFYCFGGRHRSVAIAELVNRFLYNQGFVTEVTHLDIEKSNRYLKGHAK